LVPGQGREAHRHHQEEEVIVNNIKDPEHVKNVCKIGQGPECCRYLLIDGNGPLCGKRTAVALEIDQRVLAGTYSSVGDNCEGR
jgi:hypothetical protein